MHVWMLRRYSLQSVHDYMFVISDSESVHVVRQLLLSGQQFKKKKKKTHVSFKRKRLLTVNVNDFSLTCTATNRSLSLSSKPLQRFSLSYPPSFFSETPAKY